MNMIRRRGMQHSAEIKDTQLVNYSIFWLYRKMSIQDSGEINDTQQRVFWLDRKIMICMLDHQLFKKLKLQLVMKRTQKCIPRIVLHCDLRSQDMHRYQI